MRIAVFGLGYVGIVSAACLAERGHEVIGVDPSHDKVAMVAAGALHDRRGAHRRARRRGRAVRAPARDRRRRRGRGRERPRAGLRRHAVERQRLALDDVPRARRRRDRRRRSRRSARRYTVVFRSTMLPGTCEGTLIPRLEAASGLRAGDDFGVAVNPEFLREGTSVRDFYDPPKTVVGAGDALSGDTVAALYDGLPGRRPPRADRRRRDDEVRRQRVPRAQDRLRQRDGRDLPGARRRLARGDGGLRRPTRSSTSRRAYLRPGFAFGGSCLPKDLRAHRLPRAPRRRLGADPRERAPLERGAPARASTTARRGHRQAPRRPARAGLQAGHRRPAREPDGRARRAPARQGLRPQHPRRARAHLAPHGREPRVRRRAPPAPLAAAWSRRRWPRSSAAEVVVLGEHGARRRSARCGRAGRAARRPRAPARSSPGTPGGYLGAAW